METIRGKAHWAFLTKPNTKWEKHRFEVTLEVDEKTFNEYTQKVKFGCNYKDGKFLIKIEKPLVKYDGTNDTPPVLVDANAQPTDVIVGNGSEVIVKYHLFEYTRGNHAGKSRAYLDGVQIVELIPYEPKEGESTAPATEVSFEPLVATSP